MGGSSTPNLNLGQVPEVKDPEMYKELLSIHDAIDSLSVDKAGRELSIVQVMQDYSVVIEDNIIEGDASANSVTILLPPAATVTGYLYTVKCIADLFNCFVSPQVGEMLEKDLLPFELFEGEYLDIVSDGSNWVIA